MDQLSAYGHAIVAVVLYAVVANILNAATGIRKGSLNLAPGATVDPDYASRDWRLDRTYMNAVEMLTFYAAITFAAILAGANPFWVNLLASIGLLTRLATCVIYLQGIGAGYGGIRTIMAIIASIANVGMAILALAAVF